MSPSSARTLLLCAFVAAIGIGFGAVLPSRPAAASPLLVAQALPAVGPAFVDSFAKSCTTTATSIFSAGVAGSVLSYTCQTPASTETAGTVLVAVGDSAIADPAIGTRDSPVYSGDTIREWGGNARNEFCRSDTGTVVIYCRALVATAVAP